MVPSAPSHAVDAVFRAVAHPGRRHLLGRLSASGGLTLGELVDDLPMSRQAVSQHLELLENADLVVTRWHGREKLHFLNPTPLVEAYHAWLEPLITREARTLVALRKQLEGEGAHRPASGAAAKRGKRKRRA